MKPTKANLSKISFYHILNKKLHGLENLFYSHFIENRIGYRYQDQKRGFWLRETV